MNDTLAGLKHSELTQKIIGVFYNVYTELGHGFLEHTYAEALAMRADLVVADESTQVADIVVENAVLIELKAGRALESSHEAQLLHHLRATEIEVGLLLNFGQRPEYRRLLFDNERKKIRGNPCESVARASA